MPTLAEMLRQGSFENPNNPYSSNLLADALRGSLSNAESLGRGFAAAPVGLVGDINALAREYVTPHLPAKVRGVFESLPAAPTTEQILANAPRGTETRRESSGMEQLGAAMNPSGPVEVAKGAVKGLGAYGRLAGNAVNDAMVYGRGPLAEVTPQPMRMDVWHGSPHGPFQKFDPTKARTGEGNASYGEGAYLAQARKTGEDYRNRLSDWGSPHTYEYQGQIYAPSSERVDDPVRHAVQLTYHQGKKVAQDIAKMGLRDAQKGEAYALEMGGVPYYEQMLNTAKGINKKDIKATQGFLYKVDLPDEAIPKMIDWDKPLGKQSKEVQQAIEKTKSMLPPNAIEDLGGDLSLLYGKDVTPEQFLNTWESFGQKAGGESALAEHGVTGVRYLDQGSRKSKSGTSNFVVFPQYQDLLTIKEINDKPVNLGVYK